MKVFKRKKQDLTYYQKEIFVLNSELAGLLAKEPKDEDAITQKRGQILANLKYQYKLEKQMDNAFYMEFLRNEIVVVTSEHKKQLSNRQKTMALDKENKYKISKDFVLNVKKIKSDWTRLHYSEQDEKSENRRELYRSVSMMLGVGYKAKCKILLNVTYNTLNVFQYIWNGSRAVSLKDTNRGKAIIKKSDHLDEKLKEYVEQKAGKTR